jgi:hypothetical protein
LVAELGRAHLGVPSHCSGDLKARRRHWRALPAFRDKVVARASDAKACHSWKKATEIGQKER